MYYYRDHADEALRCSIEEGEPVMVEPTANNFGLLTLACATRERTEEGFMFSGRGWFVLWPVEEGANA